MVGGRGRGNSRWWELQKQTEIQTSWIHEPSHYMSMWCDMWCYNWCVKCLNVICKKTTIWLFSIKICPSSSSTLFFIENTFFGGEWNVLYGKSTTVESKCSLRQNVLYFSKVTKTVHPPAISCCFLLLMRLRYMSKKGLKNQKVFVIKFEARVKCSLWNSGVPRVFFLRTCSL